MSSKKVTKKLYQKALTYCYGNHQVKINSTMPVQRNDSSHPSSQIESNVL